MPWPDFTELSFGYCFLREVENRYVSGSASPKAPDFIRQYTEATEEYDVEIAIDGATPVLLQFTRSFGLNTRNAKKIQDGHYASPKIYRMNLHNRAHTASIRRFRGFFRQRGLERPRTREENRNISQKSLNSSDRICVRGAL